MLPTLSLGIEFNPVVGEVGPLVTWFFVGEGHGTPAVFVGTSSDRIGTDEGEQSYYATATKRLPWWPVSAYVTANYSEADESFNVPFGGTINLTETLSMRPMYDGERTHLMATAATERFAVSLIAVWLERVGVSVSTGF